jgi:hypothetical protein
MWLVGILVGIRASGTLALSPRPVCALRPGTSVPLKPGSSDMSRRRFKCRALNRPRVFR